MEPNVTSGSRNICSEGYEELYLCFNRGSSGIVGRKGGAWIVLQGSRVAQDDTCSYQKLGRIEKLIQPESGNVSIGTSAVPLHTEKERCRDYLQ